MLQILWLGPVVNDSTLHNSIAVSPAGNRWQEGLIRALQQKTSVFIINHVPEPVWPKGKLIQHPSSDNLPNQLSGQFVGYLNFPFIRNLSLKRAYKKFVQLQPLENNPPSIIVTYNGAPANVSLAKHYQQKFGTPWIMIAADDVPPEGADGYVFLSWYSYQHYSGQKPKLHLDGGVSHIHECKQEDFEKKKIMYAGTMKKYGGVELLVNAFQQIKSPEIELWLFGKGHNAYVDAVAKTDTRIKVMGFVPDDDLTRFSCKATVFINPRLSTVAFNKHNYPSKILEYLSFGKPIISTWTAGLSPQYRDVMVILNEESSDCLANTIEAVNNWDEVKYKQVTQKIKAFVENEKLWRYQAQRLFNWLIENFPTIV